MSDTWTFDLNLSEGRTKGTEQQSGNISVPRFLQALQLADADGDGNVELSVVNIAMKHSRSIHRKTLRRARLLALTVPRLLLANSMFLVFTPRPIFQS